MTPTVFLCEPSGLTPSQRRMSDAWHQRLFGFGLDVDQLRSDAYVPDPWPGLRSRIEGADGVVVLGFRQLGVRAGTWRAGTQGEAEMAGSWSSPWLHIEAGLAIGAGSPLLVVAESGVGEGIFDPQTWTGEVRGTSMETPSVDLLAQWSEAVSLASRTSSGTPRREAPGSPRGRP